MKKTLSMIGMMLPLVFAAVAVDQKLESSILLYVLMLLVPAVSAWGLAQYSLWLTLPAWGVATGLSEALSLIFLKEKLTWFYAPFRGPESTILFWEAAVLILVVIVRGVTRKSLGLTAKKKN